MQGKDFTLSCNPTFVEIGNLLARVRRSMCDTVREQQAAWKVIRALDEEAERLRETLDESMRDACLASIAAQRETLERKTHR